MKSFGDIKTRVEMAKCLGITVRQLTHILYVKKPESYYHSFEIPKKSGGVRIISAPSDILKTLQAKLAKTLEDYQAGYINNQELKRTNISHGFEKDKSIITNAWIHRNKRYVVNFDLELFFDTFHIGRVIGYFEKNRNFMFPHEVAAAIGQLTCYQGKLPQGAPSSPIITNLISRILDFRLLRVAKEYKMDYTRYADDLTFSTNNKMFLSYQNEFLQTVTEVINRAGFTVNEKKTRIQYRDSRQEVTGLVVNKKLSVKRDYVRKTRAMAHELYKTGKFIVDGVPGNLSQLEGRFAFINQLDVHNNDQLYASIDKKVNKNSYNTRENQYRKFLFYKYFFANDKPLIVTEGITDVMYLKAALKKLHAQYPQLIEKSMDGKFRFMVSFLSKTKRLNYFLHISQDGADTMGNIYRFFTEKQENTYTPNYFRYFTETYHCKQKNPIMLLYDNENSNSNNNGTNDIVKKKKRPLANFFSNVLKGKADEKEKLKTDLRQDLKIKLVVASKLFLVTNPLVGGKSECEIEDLFSEEVLGTTLNGKTFNRNPDADNSQHYGKRKFAEYIYAHYKEIDFSNFIPLLDVIRSIVVQEGSQAD